MPGAIVVAGALIAIAVYAGGARGVGPVANAPVKLDDLKVVPVSAKDHIIGSANAEVVIIEYSDTECPYCKVFHNTMKTVMNDYKGRVAWVYRHLPIPSLHAKAPLEAAATECVAELGGNEAFWKYLDKIFAATNSNDSLDSTLLPIMAVEVGIDEAKFNTCLASGKYNKAIEDSAEEGFEAGARGTPYSLIMTKDGVQNVVNGADPLNTLKGKIDLVLE